MISTRLKLFSFFSFYLMMNMVVAQIDAPVHGEIRTYSVNGQPSVAFYSDHYQLRPLTLPLEATEDIYSFIWESDSTVIMKNSKVHLRIWGVEMDDGLRTMYEIMYGEDKYPARKREE